jgi:hypothetical protein
MTTTSFFTPGSPIEFALMGCCCVVLLLLTTGFHYEALRLLGLALRRGGAARRSRPMLLLLGICAVHVTEVFAYAAAYYLLAQHAGIGTLGGAVVPSFNASLYFSLETYSSLGYGDIVPSGALRMMAGVEALNGLLLLGWSACYAHAALDGISTATPRAERRCTRRRVR